MRLADRLIAIGGRALVVFRTGRLDMSGTLVATDWASLQSALKTISQGGFSGTLEIGSAGNPADIQLQGDLPALNPGNVTIVGNGSTIDGGGTHSGLFVAGGTLAVDDLTVANTVAQGGQGGNGPD